MKVARTKLERRVRRLDMPRLLRATGAPAYGWAGPSIAPLND